MHQYYIDYMIGGAHDASGRPTFGWVEKDGDLGDNTGPTSSTETVYVGETVDPGVIINLNACYRWSLFSSFPSSTSAYLRSDGFPTIIIVNTDVIIII